MYYAPIVRKPLTAEEMSYMSSEELNFEGAHFQHIVDFRNRERKARIDANNRRVFVELERRKGSRARW